MMSIEYRIDGRRVSSTEWQKHLVTASRDIAIGALKDKVQRIRCPVHGQAPKLIVGTRRGDHLDMNLQACCDDLLNQAKKALA
jgi:hypothetical protein